MDNPYQEFFRMVDEMTELPWAGDCEFAHIEADRLLVQALRLVSAAESNIPEDMVEQLLTAYEKVCKWYA